MEGHQARLFVRGSSKNGYRSYGIPLTKNDLGLLGLVDAKGQEVELKPLSNGRRGLAVTIGERPDPEKLIDKFMRNLDRDISFWLRCDSGDFSDPMWYNALSTMLKLLVLTSSYQLVTGPSKENDLMAADAKIELVLISSQQTELQTERTVLKTFQWLMKLKPSVILGLINRAVMIKQPDNRYLILRALYQEMINQYFTFSAMVSDKATQKTLLELLLTVKNQPTKLVDVVNRISMTGSKGEQL